MPRLVRVLLPILTALAVPAPAVAERSERFGPYVVHYNAVATAVLGPEVAREYGIVRSRQRGLITVALLRDGKPVRADIAAQARSESGRMNAIEMREIRERDSLYHIGTFPVSHKETLRFQVEVRPYGTEDDPFVVRFSNTFFTDL